VISWGAFCDCDVNAASVPHSEAHDRLMELYERLDELDADLALVRAGQILDGLGFSKSMQHTAVKHFSGMSIRKV